MIEDANKTPPEAVESGQTANLTAQGSIVASMTLLSRISGLVRDIFFAYLLGASHYADMFLVAFRIPNFFRRMFAEGAFNQAFVPVLTRYRLKGIEELRRFLSPLLGCFILILGAFVALCLLFVDELTFAFAPGFADYAGRLEATADLVYITLPYLALISLTAYAGALFNAHNRFAIPAVTPVLLNLVLIGASIYALGTSGGEAIRVLAWGVLIAGIVQLLFQLPGISRLGLVVRPNLDHRHDGVRRVGTLLLPALFASSVGQINALVNTILASTLMPGSISWIYYADRLLELPVGLVAIALSTVLLPHLSRQAATENHAQFDRTLTWGVGLGLMLGLPAAAALYLLAEGLIATLFLSIGGSAMSAYDVRMAGYALEMFAIALPGFVLVRTLSPAFYAHEDTRTPFRIACVAVAANLIVSLATFRWMGHVGLAWATAISAWCNVCLLYVALKRRGWFRLSADLWRLLLPSLVATAVLAGGILLVPAPWLDMSAWPRIGLMAVVCVGGFLLYALMLLICGVRPRDLNHESV